MTLRFEWDEEKNQINQKKHKISFETAAYVFEDENYIEMYDFEHSIEEDRYIAIGCVGDVLFVVFTERKDNIRLISARLATETERRLYYDQNIYYEKGQKPTQEQLKEVMEAKKYPIVADEDAPELSPAMYKALKSCVIQRNRKKKHSQKDGSGIAGSPIIYIALISAKMV